jgi:hypothetical protein
MNAMSYNERLLMLRELIPTSGQLLFLLVFVIIWAAFLLIVTNNKKYSHWNEFLDKFF